MAHVFSRHGNTYTYIGFLYLELLPIIWSPINPVLYLQVKCDSAILSPPSWKEVKSKLSIKALITTVRFAAIRF